MSLEPKLSADAASLMSTRGVGELADAMGIKLIELSAERAVATMPVEGNRQPLGLLHGGAYVVIAESLGSMAANVWAHPKKKFAVGIEVNASGTGLDVISRNPVTGGSTILGSVAIPGVGANTAVINGLTITADAGTYRAGDRFAVALTPGTGAVWPTLWYSMPAVSATPRNGMTNATLVVSMSRESARTRTGAANTM